MVKKIDRQTLQLLFMEALEGASYTFIEGLNPFHITINGNEFYIYIKNLSPAYFSNPDVWRVQLPIRDDFDDIKVTDAPFILLGYDAENDVYTTWNPVWVKQRLNIAESVSFYSRLSLQSEVKESGEFKRLPLNNEGEVVAFPRECLRLFFATRNGLFLETGDYVAMGSKKRTEANETYKLFTNSSNLRGFVDFLTNKSYSSVTINNYSRVVKTLITDGYIARSRKIFLACDTLEEYKGIISEFTSVPEVKEKNDKWHHLISAALNAYIVYLQSNMAISPCDEEISFEPEIDLYNIITNTEIVEGFRSYLESGEAPSGKKYNRNTVNHYIRSIYSLIEEGHFERHKDIFDRYNELNDLFKAIKEFLLCPEIYQMNLDAHHDFSASLKQYIHYLILKARSCPEEKCQGYKATEIDQKSENNLCENNGEPIAENIIEAEDESVDWEEMFTDERGFLTKIANPKLIDALRPYLDTEYREPAAAYNVIEDFYGERFSCMNLSDWRSLINDIDWKQPYMTVSHREAIHDGAVPSKKKKYILKVVLPDGTVLQNNISADTFVQVIESSYPDLIAELGIMHAGVNLVSKIKHEKYFEYQRPIEGGWYVMTNINTERKAEDLERISDELELGLRVYLVCLETGEEITMAEYNEEHSSKSKRTKIKVTFPNGRVIQPNRVLEALLEVVKYAGAERVRSLNINCCGDNMILKDPLPRYVKPSKPVGDGWLCNTCSDTPTKLEQIQKISESFNLGIVATLIE